MPTATRTRLAAPVALAGLTVLLQIAYPLVDGHGRDLLTIATVLAFLATTLTHAAATRGPVWASLYLAVTTGLGLLAEAVGVATGFPFGDYVYADSLGPTLFAVPVVVPLAWSMFAYPCLLVGQRLGHPVLLGAWALAAWDLFLDPQMVAAGHWRWLDVQHPVPGLGDIPLSNLAGWVVVSVAVMALLSRLPRARSRVGAPEELVPAALFLWTFASSVLANAMFFGRPGVALVGGLVMGAVALPYARALR